MSKIRNFLRNLDWVKIAILIVGIAGCVVAYRLASEKNERQMKDHFNGVKIAD